MKLELLFGTSLELALFAMGLVLACMPEAITKCTCLFLYNYKNGALYKQVWGKNNTNRVSII